MNLPSKISFFWVNWRASGISLYSGCSQKNIHWRALLFLQGADAKIKFLWFKRSWIRLLTLGNVELK